MTSQLWILLKSLTPDDAARFGRVVASVLEGGTVVSLEGELGSGKTFLVRQIAGALGVTHSVTSPTFVLQKIYDVPQHPRLGRIIHYDVYRLSSYDDLAELGFEELSSHEVAFVEWGDRFIEFLPRETWRIRLAIEDEQHRRLELFAPGDVASQIADALKAAGMAPHLVTRGVEAP